MENAEHDDFKQIVEGVLYSTAAAEKIGSAESRVGKSDFGWWAEDLYLTRDGAYFLHGEGYGKSHWRKRYSDGWGPGEGIKPLPEEDARAWLEQHGSPEEYLARFAVEEA